MEGFCSFPEYLGITKNRGMVTMVHVVPIAHSSQHPYRHSLLNGIECKVGVANELPQMVAHVVRSHVSFFGPTLLFDLAIQKEEVNS